LLHVPVDSYFDDYWGIECHQTVDSGFEAFKRLNNLLGFVMKESKERSPRTVGDILGLEVDISHLPLTVAVSAERIAHLRALIEAVQEAGLLWPSTAGPLVGKLQFASSGIFGRVGRAALQPLYRRQHAKKGSPSLSKHVRAALDFFLQLLADPPARVLPLGNARPPVVVYTDGNGAGCLGVVVFERGRPPLVVSCRVPQAVLDLLVVRKQQIALIELIAVIVAFEVFAEAVRGRDVLLFVDNRTAEGVVRNGYARRAAHDACALASLLWLRCAALGVSLFVEWVPSEMNISDGPSRPAEPAKSRDILSLSPVWRQLEVFPEAVERALREDLGWPLRLREA